MKVRITGVPNQFANGSGIHIKKSHEGLFTLKANRHGMGVQLFASHVLANKEDYPTETIKLANFARNASKWNAFGGGLFADGGKFALGGYHSDGLDWQAPVPFTEFNTGSTHELNGNQGIPQGSDNEGTPNLVEQGETKAWGDYIFSDRLTLPTKEEFKKELRELKKQGIADSQRGWEIKMLMPYAGKTYAEASKKIFKEIEERPNDKISRLGFEIALQSLKNSQEKQREIENRKEEADEIKSMSDLEFNDLKEALEAVQLQAQQELIAQEQAILEQQAQAEQLALIELQLALMSPEELLAYIQLMQLQLAMEQQAAQQQGYAEGGDMLEGSLETIPQDSQTPSFNIDNVEDLSTTELNNTIDLIIQYAKENRLRDIVRSARKAKKGTREDKEEFVEDTIDEINDIEFEKLQKQELENIQALEQQVQELAALEQLIQEQQKTELQMLEEVAPLTNPNAEDMATLELAALMLLPLLFAEGGFLGNDEVEETDNNARAVIKRGVETVKELSEKLKNKITKSKRSDNSLLTYSDFLKSTGLSYKAFESLPFERKLHIFNRYINKHSHKGTNRDLLRNQLEESRIEYIQNEINKTPLSKNDLSGLSQTLKEDIALNKLGITLSKSDKDKIDDIIIREVNKDWRDISHFNQALSSSATDPLASLTVSDTSDSSELWSSEKPRLYRIKGTNDYYQLPKSTTEESLKEYYNLGNVTPTSFGTKLAEVIEVDPKANYSIKRDIDIPKLGEEGNENMPIGRRWPYGLAIGLLGAGLLYNIFAPKGYDNADAIIQAANEASLYQPVSFSPIGDYLAPRRFDRNYWLNRAEATNQALMRLLANLSGGNRALAMVGILGANYNYLNSLGDLALKGEMYNAEREAREAEFNRGTNQFNAEGMLKAAMANQDAALRAKSMGLEGLMRGYTMRLAIDDARANAISSGISGIGTSLFNMAQAKDMLDLLKWKAKYASNPGIYNS